MKYTLILPCIGLLSIASAHAQATPKPGSIAPFTYQATLVDRADTKQTVVTGGAKLTYSTTSTRWGNREILTAMSKPQEALPGAVPAVPATAALLDGTISGWSLVRIAIADGTGKLYAMKAGKAAVAVPSYLLTDPVVTGSALTGTEFVPSSGSAVPASYNVSQKAYGTMTAKNGSCTISGTQTVKSGTIKIGSTTTLLQLRTENFTVIGQRQLVVGQNVAGGTINSYFKINAAKPANLAGLIP